mmetsp:Transcript_36233/g.108583  ORF Transcript_36233/g.108583 Transcript_36233/m.108583 type:complete len:120 (+) Transcript_36233:3576-3935(+)
MAQEEEDMDMGALPVGGLPIPTGEHIMGMPGMMSPPFPLGVTVGGEMPGDEDDDDGGGGGTPMSDDATLSPLLAPMRSAGDTAAGWDGCSPAGGLLGGGVSLCALFHDPWWETGGGGRP